MIRDYIQYHRVFQHLFVLLTEESTEQVGTFHEVLTVIASDRTYRLTDIFFEQQAQTYHAHSTSEELRELFDLQLPVFQQVQQAIEQAINDSLSLTQIDWLLELNEQMHRIIHYKMILVNTPEKVGKLLFEDQLSGQASSFEQLGGGEKTIIHFLFELYGRQLSDSIMIIDEPEMHLHPHLQAKFLKLLLETAETRGMQYLVSTHSPFFVTHETIGNLVRFQKDATHREASTKIYKPKYLSIKEKNLITSLDYNVAGNIFFVDKAILVE
ncbi:MAG: ATP-binding protein [Candidatus Peribacteria bacterium]|nr:MAG: ATP-binding protein [Candidatus Peribacteria bacterium]